MSTRTVPGLLPGQRPVRAEEDLAHVLREADDGEDDVRLLGDLPSACRPHCAPSSSSGCGLVLAAVVDRRGVALAHRVLAHPPAHDAGADPADAGFSGLSGGDGHCVGSREEIRVIRFGGVGPGRGRFSWIGVFAKDERCNGLTRRKRSRSAVGEPIPPLAAPDRARPRLLRVRSRVRPAADDPGLLPGRSRATRRGRQPGLCGPRQPDRRRRPARRRPEALH